MQSGSLSSNEQTRQTVFQQLQALLRDDYDNCKGLLPGETCYILAKKSILFMIQYLSLESEDSLTQIRKANAFLLQVEEHKDFYYFQRRFKSQVSHQSGDETLKVKAICKKLYESLLKEIDLKGIAIERRTKKRGIDLHPFRIEVVIMTGKNMIDVQEEGKKSKLAIQKKMVFEKIKLHVYENDSIDSILSRLAKIINKKGKEMRLYHYDDSLLRHCSFLRMIEYFLFKEYSQKVASEEQRSFYKLEENRVSLDEDYFLEFFPGKLMRGQNVARMAQKGDKYVLELKEGGWTFPEQPQFSIAKKCQFCRMKMQLYIMFTCQKCKTESLFCSRVCHYQFLLQHPCKKASKKEISSFYGEDYLRQSEDEKQSTLSKSRTETTGSQIIKKYSYSQSANGATLSTGNFGGGLANITNSCYLNASIQNLIRTSLTDQLLALERDITRDQSKPLAKAYLALIKRLQKTTAKESLKEGVMKQFKSAINIKMPQFQGQQQHDAHEFLTFFLDALREQLNTNSKITQQIKPIHRGDINNDSACNQWLKFIAKNHSPIVNLFYGQLKSQIYCPYCHSYSNRYQSFHIISLSITADRIQKQQTSTVDFFFEYHLFRDKIKYLQFQTSGYLVKDLIQEVLPSLNFVPDRKHVIKAYKLGYERECVELEGRMKISLLKQALAKPRQAQDQLFLIQAPRDSFPLFFKFIKNKQTITYKRPLFFSQPYSKLRNIKIYSTVADYLLGMARNYLCRNMAQKKKMEEMTNRINRNIAQYFVIKVVVRKGYVEEEYELIPNTEISNLVKVENLLEVEILDFQYISETEKAFSEHLVRLNRYTKVNQVQPDQKRVAKTPKNIQECVKEQFSRIELLSNGNEWLCETCNQKRRVRQTIHLYKANRYLFFQIKRFRQGTDGRYFKNLRKVKVEMQLDLTGILENPYLPEEYYQQLKDQVREGYNLPQVLDLTKSCRYQLIGMVLHEGSITRGHYTAIFKHGGWFKYNDAFVTEIKDMANLLEEPEIMERLYILLYQRIS